MYDVILVEKHNSPSDLPCVVADDILAKSAKVMKQLIQAASYRQSHDSHMTITTIDNTITVKNGVNSIHSRGVPQTGLKLPLRVYSKGVYVPSRV